jgi:hypothetical protein
VDIHADGNITSILFTWVHYTEALENLIYRTYFEQFILVIVIVYIFIVFENLLQTVLVVSSYQAGSVLSPPPVHQVVTSFRAILTAYWWSVRSVLWNIRPIFFSMDRATKERGPCKKQRSDISQYRPNKRGQ